MIDFAILRWLRSGQPTVWDKRIRKEEIHCAHIVGSTECSKLDTVRKGDWVMKKAKSEYRSEHRKFIITRLIAAWW